MTSSEAILDFIPVLFKKDVVKIPDPAPQVEPIAPIQAKTIPQEVVSVAFYGTLVSVPFPINEAWSVGEINEKLSRLWTRLSSSQYDMTIRGALDMRDGLDLCDWGYMQLLQTVCEKRYGKTNDAVFMQAYLMAQWYFPVPLARSGAGGRPAYFSKIAPKVQKMMVEKFQYKYKCKCFFATSQKSF